jgi:hypothetical protein
MSTVLAPVDAPGPGEHMMSSGERCHTSCAASLAVVLKDSGAAAALILASLAAMLADGSAPAASAFLAA